MPVLPGVEAIGMRDFVGSFLVSGLPKGVTMALGEALPRGAWTGLWTGGNPPERKEGVRCRSAV